MLRSTSIGLAATLAGSLTVGSAAAETVLRIESWVSPKHQQNAIVLPTWAKNVERVTNGRVRAVISYPPRVHPKTFFDRARTGVSDVVWSFHGYNPGRFLLTQVVEMPGNDASALEASVAYWRIHQRYLAKAGEHKGIKLLTLFAHGSGVLHSRRPITRLDQFRGLKVRVGGGVGAAISKALGVTVIAAPATKVYEFLAQGVTDAVFMTPETKISFKLWEVAPYTLMIPGGFYNGSFFMGMNPAKFDNLSKQDQTAVMSVSGEAAARMTGVAWAAADDAGHTKAKKLGNTITLADPALAKAIKQRIAGVEKAWIKKANAKGIDAAKALSELRDEIRKIKRGS